MKHRFYIQPQAKYDIDDTVIYFAFEFKSRRKAKEFAEAVKKTCKLLAEMPYIGRKKSYNNPKFKDVRVFPVSGFNYEIIYRVTEDGVLILRVLYAQRDFETLLS